MNNPNFSENVDSIDLKQEFFKYLFFWKYFLASILFFLFCAFLFNRYTPKIYDTGAKIQILDKKNKSMEMPSAEDLFSNSKINLENEIEILKSAPILDQVIRNLDLNFYVEGVGDIMSPHLTSYPFNFTSKINLDSLKSEMSFNLTLDENGLFIANINNGKEFAFTNFSTLGVKHDLPFEITNIVKEKWNYNSYNIFLIPSYNLISSLKESIIISQVGKESDIISLKFQTANVKYSQDVINEIIDVFNNDGIKDRQLIHKRTIDFVNERFEYLSSELESIELNKQSFKIENNLVNLKVNSNISLQKSSVSEETIFSNENQIYLASSLLEELLKLDFELFPLNIGIEELEINSSIQSYNEKVLEYKKLIASVGPNNPYVIQLRSSIVNIRGNIISSVKSYILQLNTINDKLLNKAKSIKNNVANMPSHEKDLREIERNQNIKETLYLFLLQKGEEAQVSYAVTEPSIKVVEYATSEIIPISPKTTIIFLTSFMLACLIPFLILYFIFLFDNKVHSREDLEKFSFNVLGEIPFFDLSESDKVFLNPEDRSIISESFRMLMSNVRYLQKNDSKSNVILVTSSIKGEGKTLNALNLALSFSSIGKKVLLIGCDLRNPQLHKYINYEKNVPGLVDFLVNNKSDWKKNVINPFDSQSLEILLSGPLPPNPLNLINNGNMDILLKEAKKIYDYIIIDSAPILLVADTQSLINKSDVLIFLTRCNVTDNNVLSNIKKISDESQTNVGVILNGVGEKNSYGYSYGYRYGYGYNYKYSYNYGYGYGYNEESS
jgi:capsular exopolysaccharide synthesis family protein